MATSNVHNSPADIDLEAIQPYNMHVSSRYLELTKRKLELTRLPHEPKFSTEEEWKYGTPKAILEPLIDFWLEHYDWRAQETIFNTILPQFRTTITVGSHNPFDSEPDLENGRVNPVRIHFVHKRSSRLNAIPLLFCHGWPGSFIELSKIIDTLAEPTEAQNDYMAGDGDAERRLTANAMGQIAFHVIAPSIPGFGFSDSSNRDGFGLTETADIFHNVMQRLGYTEYIVHGNDWGFKVSRTIALRYPEHCLAVHTVAPDLPPPSIRTPMSYLKYSIARLTKASIPQLGFGYIPTDFASPIHASTSEMPYKDTVTFSRGQKPMDTSILTVRHQTVSYSLCDSPAGLLSNLLDALRPVQSQLWSSTDILNWTMMQWLPGPEGSLRWLRQVSEETSPSSSFWRTWSNVPLGISEFKRTSSKPPMWAGAVQKLVWVKRHEKFAECAIWETPDEIVVDLRDFVASLPEVKRRLMKGVADSSA